MPEVDDWTYGGKARVLRKLEPGSWETAPQPEVDEVGQIVTVNTSNSVVTSVGVEFGEPHNRSWVYPVDYVTPTINDEVAEAIASILGGPS